MFQISFFEAEKQKKEKRKERKGLGSMELCILKFTDYQKWASCRDDKPLVCFRHKMKLVQFNHFILIEIFSVPSKNPGTGDLSVRRQKMTHLVGLAFRLLSLGLQSTLPLKEGRLQSSNSLQTQKFSLCLSQSVSKIMDTNCTDHLHSRYFSRATVSKGWSVQPREYGSYQLGGWKRQVWQ